MALKHTQEKEPSIFRQEVMRDISTFRRLHGWKRLRFVWDYFRWKLLGAVTILICLLVALHLLWQGQRPVRLRVTVVLNQAGYCTDWFDAFTKELQSDGNRAAVEVNQDQPFDYDNAYYYLHELEIMTTVSSRRMDAAVCGPDMYRYLLAIKAASDLEEVLPAGLYEAVASRDLPVKSTAGITLLADGSEDMTDTVEGMFALDLSDTAFGHRYNAPEALPGQDADTAPLYFVIIRNTEHVNDCITLAEAISSP